VDNGPGTIVGAISKDDCADYGWDPTASFDPMGVPGQSVEIGLGDISGNAGPHVGYFMIHAGNFAEITVSLGPGEGFGGSMDTNWEVPTITGSGIIVVTGWHPPTCWNQDELVCAGQSYGDSTCDGNINLADLFALKANFGKCSPWYGPGECCSDYDQSGCINLADLFKLKQNFGSSGYSPSTGSQVCLWQ
jgi:hypothetical protein